MTDFLSWYDQTIAAVSTAVRDRMTAAGFSPTHTGGGCMSWEKRDGHGGTWLVSAEDAQLDGDPNAPEWGVAHYAPDETWAEVAGCTLREALEILGGVRHAPHTETFTMLADFLAKHESGSGCVGLCDTCGERLTDFYHCAKCEER